MFCADTQWVVASRSTTLAMHSSSKHSWSRLLSSRASRALNSRAPVRMRGYLSAHGKKPALLLSSLLYGTTSRRCFSSTPTSTFVQSVKPTAIKELMRCLADPVCSEVSVGSKIRVQGWVRTIRKQKKWSFMVMNDGTTLHGLQVLLSPELTGLFKGVGGTGFSVEVYGDIVAAKEEDGLPAHQKYELHAMDLRVVGEADGQYPLQKKQHGLPFLRTIAHLRPRTSTFSALLRLRNAATMAFHNFFQEEGFLNIHTPVITPIDCEGAGELFRVESDDLIRAKDKALKQFVEGTTAETPAKVSGEPFFGKSCYLGVSGQLYAEICASSSLKVYTFGPTFRAEASDTSHHLAEFWMLGSTTQSTERPQHVHMITLNQYTHNCSDRVLPYP